MAYVKFTLFKLVYKRENYVTSLIPLYGKSNSSINFFNSMQPTLSKTKQRHNVKLKKIIIISEIKTNLKKPNDFPRFQNKKNPYK